MLTIKRSKLIAILNGHLNKPYKPTGRGKKEYGLDCIGFPISVLRELGFKVSSYHGYTDIAGADVLTSEAKKYFDVVKLNKKKLRKGDFTELKEGDMILLYGNICRVHICFYMGNGYIIQALNDRHIDRITIHTADAYWYPLFTKVFRLKGIID